MSTVSILKTPKLQQFFNTLKDKWQQGITKGNDILFLRYFATWFYYNLGNHPELIVDWVKQVTIKHQGVSYVLYGFTLSNKEGHKPVVSLRYHLLGATPNTNDPILTLEGAFLRNLLDTEHDVFNRYIDVQLHHPDTRQTYYTKPGYNEEHVSLVKQLYQHGITHRDHPWLVFDTSEAFVTYTDENGKPYLLKPRHYNSYCGCMFFELNNKETPMLTIALDDKGYIDIENSAYHVSGEVLSLPVEMIQQLTIDLNLSQSTDDDNYAKIMKQYVKRWPAGV